MRDVEMEDKTQDDGEESASGSAEHQKRRKGEKGEMRKVSCVYFVEHNLFRFPFQNIVMHLLKKTGSTFLLLSLKI